jgi:hypothetical protein
LLILFGFRRADASPGRRFGFPVFYFLFQLNTISVMSKGIVQDNQPIAGPLSDNFSINWWAMGKSTSQRKLTKAKVTT